MSGLINWRRIRLIAVYAVLFIAIAWGIHWEYVPPGSFGARLDRILRGEYFDFVTWEAEALTDKLGQELTKPQDYLQDQTRRQVVLDYLDLVTRIRQLEGEISRIYTAPEVADPAEASEEQRETLEQLRAEQARIQGTAEAILEEQIASILLEEGFGIVGQVMPPVRFHFTPLPKYLIISPRDEIALMHGAMLRGNMELDQIEGIESRIDEGFSVSSLIEPIGGLAVYPAMMNETSNLQWAIEATAHEWVHHYFFFWLEPVGLNYEAKPDVRTINETAADIGGKAIRDKVLARYYPEFLPPPPPPPDPDAPPTPTPEPPAFDFIKEMRETRVNVDQLLAEGKIDEAEDYMELRRRVFVENGYNIRKLNQAYFAFHGAYASDPGGGAAGENPIGGPVQQVWAASPSIKFFLEALAPITSREMLLALLDEMGVEYPPPTSDQS
ncbi:MAG: hypothetical protein ACK2US_11840 [Anaerolineae bacterium]